jgi:predicted amidohydrolase YtcJ
MVVLGIHASVLNTAAWKLTGYWEPGSDGTVRWRTDGSPRLGSHIVRDADGYPAGLATEMWDFRPGYSVAQYKASMRRHFREWFLAKGLTSITTLQDTAPNEFLALQELQAEGGLPVRLRVYPVVPHAVGLNDIIRVGWRSGFGDEMFRFGGVKLFIDGTSQDFGQTGPDLKWTPERLTETLTACQRGGVQTIMHVVTPEGWDLVLDCLEAATRAAPGDLRHRVDHRTPTADAQIARAKALGITCGITAPRQRPGSGGGDGYGRLHRYRTLVGQEMAIAVLDAAGPGGNYHPLRGVANMIADEESGGATPVGEAVTFDQALRMWTLWPARNNSEDRDKGSIEPGKLGDFAVLSSDLQDRSPEAVYATTTHATIVGGAVVYEA